MNTTIASLLLGGLLAAGCGEGMDPAETQSGAAASPLVGTWTEIKTPEHLSDNLYVRAFAADGTFTFDSTPGSNPVHYTGTWSATDTQITIATNYPPGVAASPIPVTAAYTITGCAQGTCLYLAYDRTTWYRTP